MEFSLCGCKFSLKHLRGYILVSGVTQLVFIQTTMFLSLVMVAKGLCPQWYLGLDLVYLWVPSHRYTAFSSLGNRYSSFLLLFHAVGLAGVQAIPSGAILVSVPLWVLMVSCPATFQDCKLQRQSFQVKLYHWVFWLHLIFEYVYMFLTTIFLFYEI